MTKKQIERLLDDGDTEEIFDELTKQSGKVATGICTCLAIFVLTAAIAITCVIFDHPNYGGLWMTACLTAFVILVVTLIV